MLVPAGVPHRFTNRSPETLSPTTLNAPIPRIVRQTVAVGFTPTCPTPVLERPFGPLQGLRTHRGLCLLALTGGRLSV